MKIKRGIACILALILLTGTAWAATKIWYKNSDPTVVISTGKSVGNADEAYFLSDIKPDDDAFYTIDQGPPQILVRKNQMDIDAIIAARSQAKTDYQQKQIDAKAELTLNDLAGKSYADVETWIDTQVTDMASARAVLKKMAKIILAMLKKGDWSD